MDNAVTVPKDFPFLKSNKRDMLIPDEDFVKS